MNLCVRSETSMSSMLLVHKTKKLEQHMQAWVQRECIYNENPPLFCHGCAGSQYENTDHRSAEIRFYSQTQRRLQTWFIHEAHEQFNKGIRLHLWMGNDSSEPLTTHTGVYFICKALRVEIIIKSTSMILKYQWKHISKEQKWSKALNTSVYAIIN